LSTPERYRRVRELYLAARGVAPAERGGWLDEACRGDAGLRTEVEELIAAETRGPDETPGRGERERPAGPPRGGAPRRIGPYVVEEAIGSGGMGVVYRAHDPRLDRPLAIKLLTEGLSGSGEARERFGRESRAASALDHRNICTVYDVGEHEGRLFLAMAYCPGGSLRERLADGPLPVDEARSVGTGVAAGLAAAHAKGIVHRDVKPANVMLGDAGGGGVRLVDFGVAKLADEAGLTRTGASLGTPGYMAPEQVRCETAGPPADVWSVGALLYEMLAGEPPFPGEPPGVLYASLHEEPEPLAEVRPDTPPWLAAIVTRCLAKRPEDRFADAGELLAALKAGDGAAAPTLAAGRGATASQRRGGRWTRGRRRALAWSAAGALTLTAGVVLFALFGPTAGPAGAAVGSIAVLPFDHPPDDPELAALAGGLAERITHNLGRLEGLSVIAAASSARVAAEDVDPAEAAERLGAGGVVVGRLDRRGGVVSVGAELVDPATGRQLWGERFDESPADLIRLEQDLSREIARAVKRRLSRAERREVERVGTAEPEAYREHLTGLHHASRQRYPEAIAAFRRAAELDPAWGAPWAEIARSYAYLGFFGRMDTETAYPQALAAVDRALELAPDLGAAWSAKAQAGIFAGADPAAALADAERGVELDPGSATAHYLLGAVAIAADRPRLAVDELVRTVELDPLSPPARMQLARARMRLHDYGGAIAALEENREIHPQFGASPVLARAYLAAGRENEAAAVADEIGGDLGSVLGALARGERGRAETLVDEPELQPAGGGAPDADAERRRAFDLLELSILLARPEPTLAGLSGLTRMPGGKILVLQVLPWPELDFLRGDPRFARFLAAHGLPGSFTRVDPGR